MPPQKVPYRPQQQEVSRGAGGHDCMSGEAMGTTSSHWDLYSKILCELYETALRLQGGFLQRGWKETAILAVHLCRKTVSLETSEDQEGVLHLLY